MDLGGEDLRCADLLEHWCRTAARVASGAGTDRVRATGEGLLADWSEPHRLYHAPQHLAEVLAALAWLGRARALTEDEGVLARLVAWYHDAVYEVPGRAAGDGSGLSNEEASARRAERELSALGASAAAVETVAAVVRATETHDLAGLTVVGSLTGRGTAARVGAAFLDADLWILAAPVARFDEYCAQVREEYAAVPDADYARGRSEVLTPFVGRDEIYLTGPARAAWTGPARSNLRRELGRLAGQIR